jgi:hypothetical protein
LMAYKDFVESGECLQFEATLMDSNGIPATTSEQFNLEAYVSQGYQFYSDGNCTGGSETSMVDFSSSSSQYFFLKVNWSEPFEVKVWADMYGEVWQGYRVNDYYNGETNYQYMAGPRAELYWNNSGTMEPLPYSLPLSDCLQLEVHTLDQDGNALNMSESALVSTFGVNNGLFYPDGACTDGTGTTSALFTTAVDSSVSNQVYFKPNGVGNLDFNMNNSSGGAADLSLEWHYSSHFVAGSALVLNHSGGGLLQPGSSYGNESCLALIVRPGDITETTESYPNATTGFAGDVSVDLGFFYTDSGCTTGETSTVSYTIDSGFNVSNETLYYKGGTGNFGDAIFTLTKTTGDAGYDPMSHWIYVDSGGGGGSFYFTYADANITDEGVQIGMYCYPNMALNIYIDIGDNTTDDDSISTTCSASGDYFFYLSDFATATGTYSNGEILKIYANSNGDYTEMFTNYGSGGGGPIKFILVEDSDDNGVPEGVISPSYAANSCVIVYVQAVDDMMNPVNVDQAYTLTVSAPDKGSMYSDSCGGTAFGGSLTINSGAQLSSSKIYWDFNADNGTGLFMATDDVNSMVHEQSFSVGTYAPYFVSPTSNPFGTDMLDIRCTSGSGPVTLEIWDGAPAYYDEMTFPDCMDGMIKAPLNAFVMIRDGAQSLTTFDLKATDTYGTGAMGQLTWQGLGASVHFMDDTGASPYRSPASSTDCVPFKLVNTDVAGAALNQTSGSDWNFQVHSEFGQFSFNSDCSAMQPGIQVTITNGTSSSPVFYYTPNGNSGPAMIMAHSDEANMDVATMLEGPIGSVSFTMDTPTIPDLTTPISFTCSMDGTYDVDFTAWDMTNGTYSLTCSAGVGTIDLSTDTPTAGSSLSGVTWTTNGTHFINVYVDPSGANFPAVIDYAL